jgi:hypothetical protein
MERKRPRTLCNEAIRDLYLPLITEKNQEAKGLVRYMYRAWGRRRIFKQENFKRFNLVDLGVDWNVVLK